MTIDAPTTEGEVAPSVSLLPNLSSGSFPCDQEGCTYVGKNAGLLGVHKLRAHGVKGVGAHKPRKSAKKGGAKPTTRAPRSPSVSGAVASGPSGRKSAGEQLTLLAVLGSNLVKYRDYPVGAMIGFEAPVLGPELDKAFAGTRVDKYVLQPLAGGWDKFETVGSLVMAPVLVGYIERLEEGDPRLPFLRGMLRMCIEPMLLDMLRAMQKAKAEEAKIQQVADDLTALDPMFAELFGGGDPIDGFLSMLIPKQAPSTPAASSEQPDFA